MDLSPDEFEKMVRRAAVPLWSQTLDTAASSTEGNSRAAEAAAVRLLSAARDAVLLEYNTGRTSWQIDMTCRYVRLFWVRNGGSIHANAV
jgi:hypothetical protein